MHRYRVPYCLAVPADPATETAPLASIVVHAPDATTARRRVRNATRAAIVFEPERLEDGRLEDVAGLHVAQSQCGGFVVFETAPARAQQPAPGRPAVPPYWASAANELAWAMQRLLDADAAYDDALADGNAAEAEAAVERHLRATDHAQEVLAQFYAAARPPQLVPGIAVRELPECADGVRP